MTTKAAATAAVRIPPIPKELIDQFVIGPMSAEAVQDIAMAFKKALIEQALGQNLKGKVSLVADAGGTAATWWLDPWVGFVVYAGVAVMWLVPDRRMEKVVRARRSSSLQGESPP